MRVLIQVRFEPIVPNRLRATSYQTCSASENAHTKTHLVFFSIFSGHISRMCTLFFSIGRGLSGGIGIRPCQKRQQSEGCTKVPSLYYVSIFLELF